MPRRNRISNGSFSGALLVAITIGIGSSAVAQSASTPQDQLWAEINASFELSERLRVKVSVEKHNGEDSPYGQRKLGAILTYRMKGIGRHLRGDVDKENEYNVVLGAGYEFLTTSQNGATKHEHRIVAQSVPKYVLFAKVLAQDRNRVEFRWTDGAYDIRYRNKLTIDRPFKIGKLRLSPYASGELFWDRKYHSWNQNQYAFGVQWPYHNVFMLDTYYQHQNCTTCSRTPLNIMGVTANFYFNWSRKK